MRPIYLAAAAAALVASGTAGAAPLMTRADVAPGSNVIQVHNTCHQNNRTHGGAYPSHHHNPGTCAMIIAGGGGGGGADCHANVQNHFIPGYGTIWHSHQGYNCGVVQHYQNHPQSGGCVQFGAPGVMNFSICP